MIDGIPSHKTSNLEGNWLIRVRMPERMDLQSNWKPLVREKKMPPRSLVMRIRMGMMVSRVLGMPHRWSGALRVEL